MSIRRRPGGDRVEQVLRSALGLALAVGVVWAWLNSAPTHSPGLLSGLLP